MDISELIQKYEDDREHYLSADYNEAQLRIDFLEPFFELLGWDIKNIKGRPTNEREVLVEEPLKTDAFSNTKKPDYTFRLFSERKFFLEAKKPSVRINEHALSARQIRRYGFTAKLKVSVLSNFEYLAIYDCSQKIKEDDITSHSRTNLYHYSEYVEKFDEIKKQLGRDNVYSGAFDEIWKDIEEQLKLFSVDKLFLEQINKWRIVLGEEIYSHNSELEAIELNDTVHRYLNSIIFLRVCEDRNLEEYQSLLKMATEKDFDALINKFVESDKKYNSGLFDHQLVEEVVKNNCSAFWAIIQQLYFPESTYSFSVFGSDILGNIYEIFIGQQLTIEDGCIKLKNKPEHLDRDIVTTPTFVIRDILRATVKEYCEDKTDQEILNSCFADIACGSGAFLVETYQLLNDILIDYYIKNSPDKLIQISASTFKLPYTIKRQLIEKSIYGIDKDYNAVEATKFGLLIKLIEGEDNKTVPIPVLPDLSSNIQYGNSLIESSYVSDENREEINPYDFHDMKFDVIIGNPPYMATEHMAKLTPAELPLYKKYYNTSYKQFDKYYLFIERSYFLLKDDGLIGYIVPSKFTKVGAGKNLRALLKNNKCVQRIISFGANQVFKEKTTYTCLLIVQKKEQDGLRYIEIKDLKDWQTRKITRDVCNFVNYDALENDVWILVPDYLKTVWQSIVNQSEKLIDIVGPENIYNGIQTSANSIYVHFPLKEDANYFYFQKDNKKFKVEKELTRPYFKTSSGIDNLYTYRAFKPNSFVIYPYLKTDKGVELVEIKKLEEKYPFTFEYLKAYENKLADSKRDIKPEPKTENEWYRYGRHQSLETCDVSAKIVVGVLSQGNKYAIDYCRTLISSGGTAGYCMITLPDGCKYSIYYIQALLNSKYIEWCSALMGEVFRGGYVARGTKVLKRLPVRKIDFENVDDVKLHNRIVCLQKRLIKIQSEIDKNPRNKRKLIPLIRTFGYHKDKMDVTLKILFTLKEDDGLIPLIGELYAAN